jgi:thiamine biosynthesis lipoprotein
MMDMIKSIIERKSGLKIERKRGREKERKIKHPFVLLSFRSFVLSSLLLLTASSVHAAGNKAVRVVRHIGLMGTTLTVSVEAVDRPTALAAGEKAVRALEAAEARLSTWREDTELARLNRATVGETVALSQKLAEELAAVRHWWKETNGAFDPGIGVLVDIWGLRQGGRRPTSSMLAQAKACSGLAALSLNGRTAVRQHPDLKIEEGGFGKGAGLDAAIRILGASNILSATIDLGGQVAVIGNMRPFSLAIADPANRHQSVLRVSIDQGAIATSGNSERGLVIEGTSYSHILDPRSGQPVPDFGTLTVWAPDALTADCLSTGLYVLGPDQALDWAAQHPGIEVLVLETTGSSLQAHATAGWKDRIKVEDPRVELVFEEK